MWLQYDMNDVIDNSEFELENAKPLVLAVSRETVTTSEEGEETSQFSLDLYKLHPYAQRVYEEEKDEMMDETSNDMDVGDDAAMDSTDDGAQEEASDDIVDTNENVEGEGDDVETIDSTEVTNDTEVADADVEADGGEDVDEGEDIDGGEGDGDAEGADASDTDEAGDSLDDTAEDDANPAEEV